MLIQFHYMVDVYLKNRNSVFNLKDIPSEQLSSYLSENGFCLRAGLHCSALAHETLGTKTGTVRFSPSFFNNVSDVKNLCYTLKNASYAIEKI